MPTIDHCLGCPYRFGAAIGPRGNPVSRIVLVGAAPGATEIVEGEPFRGPAGDVLCRTAEYPMLVADLKHARRVAYGPGV